MIFNSDGLESFTRNQFEPWKTPVDGITPRNSILHGRPGIFHPSSCMDIKPWQNWLPLLGKKLLFVSELLATDKWSHLI